jgi:hypothetical protein
MTIAKVQPNITTRKLRAIPVEASFVKTAFELATTWYTLFVVALHPTWAK